MEGEAMIDAGILAILAGNAPDGREDAIIDRIKRRLFFAPPALERMASLAAWKKAWQAKNPDFRRGGDRKSAAARAKQNQKTESDFWSEVWRGARLSQTVVKEDVRIATDLGAAWIERLLGSPLDNTKEWLRSFAALDERLREKIDRIMRAHPEEGWDGWAQRAGLEPEPKSAEAEFERGIRWWEKQPREMKRRFLRTIGVPDDVIGEIVRREKKGRDE